VNDCEHYQELISRLLDDDLKDDEKVVLATHLKGCEECRAVYKAFRTLSDNIHSDMIAPPIGFTENVMASVKRSEIKKRSRNTAKKILAAVACLVLVIASGYRLLPKAKSSAKPEAYSSSTAADRFTDDDAPAEMAAAPKMNASAFSVAAEPEAEESDDISYADGISNGAEGAAFESYDISDEVCAAILSGLTECSYPDSSVIERTVTVYSSSVSFDILFCEEHVIAVLDNGCFLIPYSPTETMDMIS